MSLPDKVRQHGAKPRACGCKGIRSCKLCTESPYSEHVSKLRSVFQYCSKCKKAWHVESTPLPQNSYIWHQTTESKLEKNFSTVDNPFSSNIKTTDLQKQDSDYQVDPSTKSFSITQKEVTFSMNIKVSESGSSCVSDTGSGISDSNVNGYGNGVSDGGSRCCEELSKTDCSHKMNGHFVDFEGIQIVENFITEEEEAYLDSCIAKTKFMNSQSGRRKQDYGPKANFKKQRVRTANFNGLPSYSNFLYVRMKSHPFLSTFQPVELCNLEYCKDRGAHIDAHFDDDWLWGERLVTLNLLSDSALTFTLDSEPSLEVRVPLFRRSLIVVSSDARYKWKHSILSEDIQERRLAMTFRELSNIFSSGGAREHEGSELLKLALSFEGCAVSG